MSFDGIRKTEEPKIPDGMTALRMVVGYNNSGRPVHALCDQYWNITGLPEKCDHCGCEDCDDCEEIDNSDLIPVSHVQRIMWFVPTEAPAAKVTKAMDLSALIATEPEPVSIEMVAPDSDSSKPAEHTYIREVDLAPVKPQSTKARHDEELWGIGSR